MGFRIADTRYARPAEPEMERCILNETQAVKRLVDPFLEAADRDASAKSSGHGTPLDGDTLRTSLVEHHPATELSSLLDLKLPEQGKGKDGACMDYALALSSKLAANGIHGRLIFYRWHIRTNGITGSHVFVVYHLADGTEWIVDNEIAAPKEVPDDATPMHLVFLLSGDPSAPVDVELQNGLNRLSFF